MLVRVLGFEKTLLPDREVTATEGVLVATRVRAPLVVVVEVA